MASGPVFRAGSCLPCGRPGAALSVSYGPLCIHFSGSPSSFIIWVLTHRPFGDNSATL